MASCCVASNEGLKSGKKNYRESWIGLADITQLLRPFAHETIRNWTIFRPDYQRILYDAAVRHGAIVKFGITVQDPSSVEADLVILADGW